MITRVKLPIRVKITDRARNVSYIYQDKKGAWYAAKADSSPITVGAALGVKDVMAVQFALENAERQGGNAVIRALREFVKDNGLGTRESRTLELVN